MPFYEVEFAYKIEEFGIVTLEADDPEQAGEFGRDYVRETFLDVQDIVIDSVKEIKR